MQLRPYQIDAETAIYKAWENGAKNVLIQLDTGAGKTVLFTKIAADNPGMTMLIAHRIELVSQISLTLARRGIRHNIIASAASIRIIIALHMQELKISYYDINAKCSVAGVDTLIRMPPTQNPWFQKVTLVIQDEGHHPLKKNKWGRAAELFPNARGLYPTATPIRADGYGLGRHADGLMDALVTSISMSSLINQGYLTPYRIYAPQNNLDLSTVPLSASGDYSPPKLRTAVQKSTITGDIIKHYLKIAPGKLGVTFAVDVAAAVEIAKDFKSAGVSAEVISSKTPDILRSQIMEKFRKREILQLVNVDLLGEGVDVPAIEVVIMARPTQSYAVYSQQFGRALRPMANKTHAIIIDHVGNVLRHGLPDRPRVWTLDRREKRTNIKADNSIPLKNCLNPECMAVYERIYKMCPHCLIYSPPANRSSPDYVDGDLTELSESTLAKLRGEITRIDATPKIPNFATSIVRSSIIKRHAERQTVQALLRTAIADWAGHYKIKTCNDSEIYRRFYFEFGIDVLTAQTLGLKDAGELLLRVNSAIDVLNNKG